VSDVNPEALEGAEVEAEEREPVEHPPLSVEGLKQRFAEDALSALEFRGELTLIVPAERIVDVCHRLKTDPEYGFNVCMDISAVDHLPRQPRFDVNYHLANVPSGQRLRVKVMLPGPDPVVESVTSVWGTADWWEREVYDLMGVVFTGHPDLRRIEMPEDWEGHPHRRDYPVGKNPISFTPPPPGFPAGQ
jgi:NADH-quinone oxidoreductase subunit C